MHILARTVVAAVIALLLYGAIGTGTRVDEIKEIVENDIESRGWTILRYEGYQYGSFANHGGKVWYHVKDNNHKNTYYRVFITLWGGELHYNYGAPEKLTRLNFDESE